MPSAKIKAPLPKDDRNGLDAVAQLLCERPGEKRLYVVVMHVAKIEHNVDSGDDDGDDVAYLAIDQVELVDRDVDYVDAAMVRAAMLRAQQRRNGTRVLPFELEANLEALFPHLVTEEERERREDDNLTAADRLRRHLERVHGYNGSGRDSARTMTDTEAAGQHRTDHTDERINHPTGFDGWTRHDVAGLPGHLLAYSTADEMWELLDRAGRSIAHADIAGDDVDKAQAWAGDQVESLTGDDVIGWYDSDHVDGAYVPVTRDQARRPEPAATETDNQSDPTLFDDPGSPASDPAGQPDDTGSPDGEAFAPDASAGEGVGTAEPVPAAVFSTPDSDGSDGPVDLDGDTRGKRDRRAS
jgi:hypothetical protein